MRLLKTLSTLTLPLTLLVSSAVHSATGLGIEYYDSQQFEKAYAEFSQSARAGDHLAQRNLGVMYVRGEHVERDLVRGHAWIALSEQHQAYADEGLGDIVWQSIPEDQRDNAESAHQTLLAQYGKAALRERMQPEFSGSASQPVQRRVTKRVTPQYPRTAARRGMEGWVDIMFTIEKDGSTSDHLPYYSTHDLLRESAMEAMRQIQFEPQSLDGDPVRVHGATYRFIFQLGGEDTERTRVRMVDRYMRQLRESAEEGNPQDQYVYGYMLSAAQSYSFSPEIDDNANEWFLAAAEQGYHPAGFFLGKNTLYGNQCEVDTEQSHLWLIRSARNGVSESQYLLAMELMSGTHFEQDEHKALYWLEEAGAGNTPARLRHAWLRVTHPDRAVRSAERAEQLWQSLDEDYHDRQRYYQTAAAIAAERGDFAAAVEWQNKAKEDARELGLPLNTLEAQLARYQSEQAWREAP